MNAFLKDFFSLFLFVDVHYICDAECGGNSSRLPFLAAFSAVAENIEAKFCRYMYAAN